MIPRSFDFSPAAGVRGACAVFLALLVAAVVDACPTGKVTPVAAVRALPYVPTAAQDKKEPPKKEPDKKTPDKKEEAKPPEIKWPTELNGKDLAATLKDIED